MGLTDEGPAERYLGGRSAGFRWEGHERPIRVLVAAWDTWDLRPGAEDAARARMDALAELCDWAGVPDRVMPVHAAITARRRAGLTRTDSILGALEETVPQGLTPLPDRV